MQALRMTDAESGRCLLPKVIPAVTFLKRFLGLMGRSALAPGTGMLFRRCNSIHMFFMRFSIDVVYLDPEDRVQRIVPALKPWRISWCRGAASVLEGPAGWARQAGLHEGQLVGFETALEGDR